MALARTVFDNLVVLRDNQREIDCATNMLKKLNKFKESRLAVLSESEDARRAVLVRPAQDACPEELNQVIEFSKGLCFVSISEQRANDFVLSPMGRQATMYGADDSADLRLCVSVEAREGISTGISAADRARTVAILGEAIPKPGKLVKPGHIFPVVARDGGSVVRHAIPEGALDIVRLSGFSEAALFMDLLNERGERASAEEVESFAERHAVPHFHLEEITRYRLEEEHLVYQVAEAKIPSSYGGSLTSIVFRSKLHDGEHVALVKGPIDPQKPVLTRVQRESTISDVFGSSSYPSRHHIAQSLREIGDAEQGVLVYLRRPQPGAIQSQIEKLQGSAVGQRAADQSIMREYGIGAQILRTLGVKKIALLTSTKKDLVGLKTFGIEIVSQQAIPSADPRAEVQQ